MVSPSKNIDTSTQNYKYGFVCKKNVKALTGKGSKAKIITKRKLPYLGKNIYIDLKSRKESQKLETTLKNLGATIALFLDKTVTHVVSDRVDNSHVTVASPAASVSPLLTPSPGNSDRSSFPRSRGIAMLERVSSYSYAGYADPIQLASQWGITVLSVSAIWRDASRFQSDQYKKKSAVVENQFIKIECSTGTRKPDLLKLTHWPVLDVDCPAGISPFQWAKTGDGVTHTVTSHSWQFRSKFHVADWPQEVTYRTTPFDGLPFVLCKMTRRPLKNANNSEEDSNGANIVIKSSPLCNGHVVSRHSSQDDLKVQCNGLVSNQRTCKLLSPSGSDVLPFGSQRRSTRRASASWCGSTRELAQLSPTDSELGITLRPKGTLWLPVALIGTTAEEHGNSVRRPFSADIANDRPKRKKLSPEEKLLQDNKEYFKMEVLNTKLRSSGSLVCLNKEAPQINKIILKKVKGKKKWTKTKEYECDSVDYEALIVQNKIMKMNGVSKKPKKPRRSELMKLCIEAESFMFGESSRQSGATTLSEDDRKEDNSLDSSCWDDGRQRRKRRSHAEAFIHDNLDYYKFETTGTRLRSQGSFCESEPKSDDVKEEPIDCRAVTFSFQIVPSAEPWYDTYKRQDDGKEEHFPVISDKSSQPFLLPYELPRPVYPARQPEPSDYYAKRRKRLAQIIAQNHPRKSPRCHASTLAILSSLKKRKRKSSTTDHESSPRKQDDFLGIASDEEVEEILLVDPVDPKNEPNRRRKKTDDRLALENLSPDVVIETSKQSKPAVDVVEMVQRFRYDESLPMSASMISDCELAAVPHRTPKKRRKWRKINRTGWEKAKVKVKKVKSAPLNRGIVTENIVTSPRRTRNSVDADLISSTEVSPCVVRVRKLSLRNGDDSTTCRKLVFTKRKRTVTDYSWTTTPKRR